MPNLILLTLATTGSQQTATHHNNEHRRIRLPLDEDILAELLDGRGGPPVADDGHARLDVPDQDRVRGQDGRQDFVAVADHLVGNSLARVLTLVQRK